MEDEEANAYEQDFLIKYSLRTILPDGTISENTEAGQILENLKAQFSDEAESLAKLETLSVDMLIDVNAIVSKESFSGTLADAIKTITEGPTLVNDGTFAELLKNTDSESGIQKLTDKLQEEVSKINEYQ